MYIVSRFVLSTTIYVGQVIKPAFYYKNACIDYEWEEQNITEAISNNCLDFIVNIFHDKNVTEGNCAERYYITQKHVFCFFLSAAIFKQLARAAKIPILDYV